MKKLNTLPVFAFGEEATWDDLVDAMEASVQYQSCDRGKILPLMCFAPMMEPENLDTWEPLKTKPDNLLVISIERSKDAVVLEALRQAEPELGEGRLAGSFPAVQVDLNDGKPVADVYRQMSEAGIAAFAMTHPRKDDASFFFLLGKDAVLAFDRALREVTRGA